MSTSASQRITLPKITVERQNAGMADAGRNVDTLRRWVAWSAMLVGSALPNIVSRVTGVGSPYLLPVVQTVLLVLFAIFADRLPRLKPLTGFLLTIAIIRLGWFAIAPMLDEWPPLQTSAINGSWAAQQFFQRLLLTIGALLLLTTFIGRRFTRCDLFLRLGDLSAPAHPEPILWFRKAQPWSSLGPQLLVLFGIALPVFLFLTLRPDFVQLPRLAKLLPWAVATAIVNAGNEEFQFRCVPLAHLREALPQREAIWLTSIFFGLGHYFGQPSGPVGVVMATVAGWIWAKSMVETRGVGWAFGIHMVQDLVIFCFLALSVKI